MKSDIVMENKYDMALAKLSIVKSEIYWQKLINMDSQRSMFFPGNYFIPRFGNEDIQFLV